MAEFAYNNAKNAGTGHMAFELNCGYHPRVSYREDIDPRSKFKLADEILVKLQDLMTVCQKNLYHAQELQKRAYDKGVKPESYTLGDKVWLNNKYLKSKENQKLKTKFFEPFRIIHPVEKLESKLIS